MERAINADSFWTYYNGTLKNKFNIEDSKELDKKETEIINNKLKNVKMDNFSKEDFLDLHKYLFEDLYEFAGLIRDENIVINNVMMCQKDVVDLCLHDLFKLLGEVKITNEDDLYNFLAYYYSELSIIAPFRDGNDITIKTFLELYTKNLGYDFTFNNINNDELQEALIYAFYHDTSKLIDLFKQI